MTGNYVYDADTNLFSNINVSAVGPTFPASSFTLDSLLLEWSDESHLDLVPDVADLTGYQDVYIALDGEMTNEGGTIRIDELTTYECYNAVCDDYSKIFEFDSFVTASVSVSEPSIFALIALGLVASLRRKVK
ncbi:hypothetical protein [Alteromonas sp. ASW11-130]|uniref:hypothetical protein n=1 Tax=Alteromonas sp. ASW11-130 TaxID=3015775 RepID=UPI0022420C73|nr:hypothetical protein [Alteromonas sp. ASW11-130]MCW8093170.1 hypothetical protein [Alteromonas sp. ASW11-130]